MKTPFIGEKTQIRKVPAILLIGVFLTGLVCLTGCKKDNKVQNHPPVAKAGVYQTIQLPTDSVWLDGGASTDPDNDIIRYAWRKVDGPLQFVIEGPDQKRTKLSKLVEGVYRFELKVTDAAQNSSLAYVNVYVGNAPAPDLPQDFHNCDTKFTDKTETLIPYLLYTINSTVTPQCSCSQVSGPSTAVITHVQLPDRDPASRLTNLVKGKYVFKITCNFSNNSYREKLTTLYVVEDTTKGKEYFFESAWWMDDWYFPSLTAMISIDNRPDLFYKENDAIDEVAIRSVADASWTTLPRSVWGVGIYETCLSSLYISGPVSTVDTMTNKKVYVRVRFK
jgi:hypothetical protein